MDEEEAECSARLLLKQTRVGRGLSTRSLNALGSALLLLSRISGKGASTWGVKRGGRYEKVQETWLDRQITFGDMRGRRNPRNHQSFLLHRRKSVLNSLPWERLREVSMEELVHSGGFSSAQTLCSFCSHTTLGDGRGIRFQPQLRRSWNVIRTVRCRRPPQIFCGSNIFRFLYPDGGERAF